jgi:Flp pilus assembly protein TadB
MTAAGWALLAVGLVVGAPRVERLSTGQPRSGRAAAGDVEGGRGQDANLKAARQKAGHRRTRRISARRRPSSDSRRLQCLAAAAVGALCLLALPLLSAALACVTVVPAAAAAIGRLHAHGAATSRMSTARQSPFVLALVAAALRAGVPLARAVELAAPAADPQTAARLSTVVGLLKLGADADQAWLDDGTDPAWSVIARAARQSSRSGVRVARAFDELAIELRESRRSESLARADRAAVFAVAPLGLCFLPAFVCVGVIPVVIGICAHLGFALG